MKLDNIYFGDVYILTEGKDDFSVDADCLVYFTPDGRNNFFGTEEAALNAAGFYADMGCEGFVRGNMVISLVKDASVGKPFCAADVTPVLAILPSGEVKKL